MRIRFAVIAGVSAVLAVAGDGSGQAPNGYGIPSYQSPSAFGQPSYAAPSNNASATAGNPWATPRVASNPAPDLGPLGPPTGNFGPVTPLPPTNQGPILGPPPGPTTVQGGSSCQSSPYMQAMSAPWDAASCGAPSYFTSCGPACPTCPKWFGGIYGLVMDLGDEDPFYFVMPPSNPGLLYFTNNDAQFQTAGGVEARIGRTFCNCAFGLEFVYWELFPDDQYAYLTSSSLGYLGFYTTMNYQDVYLDFNNGPPGNPNYRDTIHNQFNGQTPIQSVELYRSWNIRNIELNLLSGPLVSAPAIGGCGVGSCGVGNFGAVPVGAPYCGGDGCGVPMVGCGCNRLMAGWLFGIRYFNFDEYMRFTARNISGMIDNQSPNNEFSHVVDVSNDLVGVQLGFHADYCVCRNLILQTGSGFGIYGNNASVYQRIFNGHGNAYVNPTDPMWYALRNSDSDVAFLGELRAGLGYRIGCHWRLTGGYRAVAACGIARAFDQLPDGRTLADYNRIAIVDRDSCLLLHGAYAGAEFCW